MAKGNGSPDFPTTEEFVDFSGRTRKFVVKLDKLPIGYCVSAVEDVKGDDGYAFRAFSSVDPYQALADLRKRIPKLLSVRHLVKREGRLSLTHDRMRGRISATWNLGSGSVSAGDWYKKTHRAIDPTSPAKCGVGLDRTHKKHDRPRARAVAESESLSAGTAELIQGGAKDPHRRPAAMVGLAAFVLCQVKGENPAGPSARRGVAD